MFRNYEDFIAVSGLLEEQPEILCIGCKAKAPESGCDHCTNCLAALESGTPELQQVAA
jgi:predicted amidophosphoribosyltransferase